MIKYEDPFSLTKSLYRIGFRDLEFEGEDIIKGENYWCKVLFNFQDNLFEINKDGIKEKLKIPKSEKELLTSLVGFV